MYKKYAALILAAAVALCSFMTGCGDTEASSDASSTASESTSSKEDVSSSSSSNSSRPYTVEELGLGVKTLDDKEHKVGYQLETPDVGEEVAVMHTNMGDITMRFFPEAAPNAVENFTTHAKDGYYDNLTFHRVINDFMIQGGDPLGNGTGGESITGKPFEDEFSNKLFNIRGSVAMANSGANTNGSQFFINQNSAYSADDLSMQWESMYQNLCSAKDQGTLEGMLPMWTQQYYTAFYDTDLVSQEIIDLYNANGGNAFLDGAFNVAQRGHTVFAQVIKGMDVVDKIAAVKTDDVTNKPLEDVIIESIEIVPYK